MSEKTIAFQLPQPGDALPFDVLDNGMIRLRYNADGRLVGEHYLDFKDSTEWYELSYQELEGAQWVLGIPKEISVDTFVALGEDVY